MGTSHTSSETSPSAASIRAPAYPRSERTTTTSGGNPVGGIGRARGDLKRPRTAAPAGGYRVSTGQVRVRVTPSTDWMGITTPFASSSRSLASPRAMTS